MQLRVAVLGGDGVGPEVAAQAAAVLEETAAAFGHRLELVAVLGGVASIEVHGTALTEAAFADIAGADALLFGAIGAPTHVVFEPERSPERMLLRLRKDFELFANLRPVRVYESLIEASPLRPELLHGVDLVVVRELTGGLYYGTPSGRSQDGGVRRAVDTLPYDEREIERVARVAFAVARSRPRRKLSSVDKANVLSTSRLWREVVGEVARDFPDVALEHVLVDHAAMRLIGAPASFDVLLTENMFGDILTDEAAVLAGSIGLLGSASLGARTNRHGHPFGLYEPIHGSAPDIAGRGIANPAGAIASAAMLLRHSFGLEREADLIERALARTFERGARTADLAKEETSGTAAFAGAVRSALLELHHAEA